MASTCRRASVILTFKLSSGHEMPMVGLGTWQSDPDDLDAAVTAALDEGYKHIDAAYVYDNEEAIGKSLKKWFDKGGKREDLFITTKLPGFGNRASEVEKCLKISLKKLGLRYVDLYLVHTPVGVTKKNAYDTPGSDDSNIVFDTDTDHISLWKAMEAQVKAGRARAIGLSNFNVSQVLRVLSSSEIKPSNVQVELHVYMQQKPLRELCAKHNITVTAYSPLGSPGSNPDEMSEACKSRPKNLEHPVVTKIARNHKKSPAQVLLRHLVQNNVIVIPKSTNPVRIKQNIDIFDFKLSEDEMKQLDALDLGEQGRLFYYFFFGDHVHPEYPYKEY